MTVCVCVGRGICQQFVCVCVCVWVTNLRAKAKITLPLRVWHALWPKVMDREGRKREKVKRRELEESWPHAATLICAFPSWVRKTKRRHQVAGLKTLSYSYLSFLFSTPFSFVRFPTLSTAIAPLSGCVLRAPARCWVQKLIALEKLHRVAHVPTDGNEGKLATRSAKLALI